MKLTPEQRRKRIYRLAEADEQYGRMMAEYMSFKERFTNMTDRLPTKLSSFLWSFPGMGYFVHHRMLTLICENMEFPDET